MEHTHNIIDDDPIFTIDDRTRSIVHTSDERLVLIQGDHNSEEFTFKIPKTVDGHDMTKCNLIQVHYINVYAEDQMVSSSDIYTVTDMVEDENDFVKFSWLVSQTGTVYVGTLNFAVRFACKENGRIVYSWNTSPYTNVYISKGINSADALITDYGDTLDKWYTDLENLAKEGVQTIEQATEDGVKAIEDCVKAIEKSTEDSVKAIGDSTQEAIEYVVSESIGKITIDALNVHDLLVQETGQSPNRMMSQKATTDVLNDLESKVDTKTVEAVNEARSIATEAVADLGRILESVNIQAAEHGEYPIEPGHTYRIYPQSGTFKFRAGTPPENLHIDITESTLFESDTFKAKEGCDYAEFRFVGFDQFLDYQGQNDYGVSETYSYAHKLIAYVNGDKYNVYKHEYEILYSRFAIVGASKVELLNPSMEHFSVDANGIADVTKTKTDGLIDTYTISFDDGTTKTFDIKNGNGIADISKTSTNGPIDTYAITLDNGITKTFEVNNGNEINEEEILRIINEAVKDKASTTYVNDAVKDKASTTYVNDAVKDKATTTYVNDAVKDKASTTYVNDAVKDKATTTYVNDAVKNKASTTYVNNALNNKASTAYVDEAVRKASNDDTVKEMIAQVESMERTVTNLFEMLSKDGVVGMTLVAPTATVDGTTLIIPSASVTDTTLIL